MPEENDNPWICPVCGGNENHAFQRVGVTDLSRCNNCTAVFTDPAKFNEHAIMPTLTKRDHPQPQDLRKRR